MTGRSWSFTLWRQEPRAEPGVDLRPSIVAFDSAPRSTTSPCISPSMAKCIPKTLPIERVFFAWSTTPARLAFMTLVGPPD